MDEQSRLFAAEPRGRRRGVYGLSYEQFVHGVLEAIGDYRSKGVFPTRDQVAGKMGMDVSTFDRYRGSDRYNVFRDWTESVRQFDALMAAHRLESAEIVPALPAPQGAEYVVAVEHEHDTIVAVNDAACQLLGFHRAELIGAPYEAMVRPGVAPLRASSREAVDQGRRVASGEIPFYVVPQTYWITRTGQRIDMAARVTWDGGLQAWVVRGQRLPLANGHAAIMTPAHWLVVAEEVGNLGASILKAFDQRDRQPALEPPPET
jgi:PAS domain-containing protein